MDVLGEEVDSGLPLVYYECTGNWNQLFSPRPDRSVTVTRPDLISQLRRKDLKPINETLCLQSQIDVEGVISLVTGQCSERANKGANGNLYLESDFDMIADDMKFHFILGDDNSNNNTYKKKSGLRNLELLAPRKMSLDEAAADGRATLEAQRMKQRRIHEEKYIGTQVNLGNSDDSGRSEMINKGGGILKRYVDTSI